MSSGCPADIAAARGPGERARPEARLRRGPRAGRALSTGRRLGAFGDASRLQPERHQARDRRRGRPGHLPRPGDAERFSFLRAYGFKDDYNCRYIGLNGKLSELNAALGLAVARPARGRSWPIVTPRSSAIDRRWTTARRWPGKRCPPGCVHGYKDLAVRFRTPEQRAAAEAALAAAGIMTKRYFFPAHRMEVYRVCASRVFRSPNTSTNACLCIPLYHDLR